MFDAIYKHYLVTCSLGQRYTMLCIIYNIKCARFEGKKQQSVHCAFVTSDTYTYLCTYILNIDV